MYLQIKSIELKGEIFEQKTHYLILNTQKTIFVSSRLPYKKQSMVGIGKDISVLDVIIEVCIRIVIVIFSLCWSVLSSFINDHSGLN